MNATLKAMARALFQSWFVDFEPVRAKLDGRQVPGFDPSHRRSLSLTSFKIQSSARSRKGGKFIHLAISSSLHTVRLSKRMIEGVGTCGLGSNGLVGWHNERLFLDPASL